MKTTIKLAYHNKTQQIIHIDNAGNGLSCDCKCVLCDEQLEARQGKVRDWHFKHHKNINCAGGQETALHRLGKQILVDNSKITIPGHDTILYSHAIAEKGLYTKRPDVTARFENEEIFFEIFVFHAVDSEKEKMFIDGQHKSMEIDLSQYVSSTFEEIKLAVLEWTTNKRVIFWEQNDVLEVNVEPKTQIQVVTPKTKDESENWLEPILYLVITTLVVLGLRELFPNRRRRKYNVS